MDIRDTVLSHSAFINDRLRDYVFYLNQGSNREGRNTLQKDAIDKAVIKATARTGGGAISSDGTMTFAQQAQQLHQDLLQSQSQRQRHISSGSAPPLGEEDETDKYEQKHINKLTANLASISQRLYKTHESRYVCANRIQLSKK